MAYEPREGSGSLFKNDKGGVESRPDYRGDIMVGGVTYSISSWIKEGKNGKFMSLSAQVKEGQAPQPAQRQQTSRPAPDFQDSDVPF